MSALMLVWGCAGSESPLELQAVNLDVVRHFPGERARFIRNENGYVLVGTSAALYRGTSFQQLDELLYPDEVPTLFTAAPDSNGAIAGLGSGSTVFLFTGEWVDASPSLPSHPDGAPNFFYDIEWIGSRVLVAGNHGTVLFGGADGWVDVGLGDNATLYAFDNAHGRVVAAGDGVFQTEDIANGSWETVDGVCAPRIGLVTAMETNTDVTWYADVRYRDRRDYTTLVRTSSTCDSVIELRANGRVRGSFSTEEATGFIFLDGRVFLARGNDYEVLMLPVMPIGVSLQSQEVWVLWQTEEGAVLGRVQPR
ncbi:MAG TPA: hypothetical protein VF039_00360 [Longimicrobiales bacterium]